MQATIPASVSLAVSAPRSTSRRRSYGRSRSRYGRSYSRGGRRSYYSTRAIARKAYVRGKWPSSEWAHPRVRRGSAAAAALGIGPAGSTFQEVPAEQQAVRRAAQWYGRGNYMQGRGGYIGRMAGGLLGGLAGTALGGTSAFASGGALAGLAPTVASGGAALGAAFGDELEDRIRSKFGNFQ